MIKWDVYRGFTVVWRISGSTVEYCKALSDKWVVTSTPADCVINDYPILVAKNVVFK